MIRRLACGLVVKWLGGLLLSSLLYSQGWFSSVFRLSGSVRMLVSIVIFVVGNGQLILHLHCY